MEKEENKAGEEEHWQGSLEQYSEKKTKFSSYTLRNHDIFYFSPSFYSQTARISNVCMYDTCKKQ